MPILRHIILRKSLVFLPVTGYKVETGETLMALLRNLTLPLEVLYVYCHVLSLCPLRNYQLALVHYDSFMNRQEGQLKSRLSCLDENQVGMFWPDMLL